MNTAAPPTPASAPEHDTGSVVNRLVELTGRVATSWFGAAAGYFAAILSAVLAYQKLEEPLKGLPWWVRPVLAIAPIVFVLVFHTLPALVDQRRRKRLGEIAGELKPGYFRLTPIDEESEFKRADNKHAEVLRWLKASPAPVLYLTGQSGSGKSSLLAAWVLPKLAEGEPAVKVLKLRAFQDPAGTLEQQLRIPGLIWQRPPADVTDFRQLLERACRQLRPRRMLLVLDQFEEFVILHNESQRERFETLLASLVRDPIDNLTVLLVVRSDYIGLLEKLRVPKLVQDTNWQEVPPFTEAAARAFMRDSGLTVSGDVLHEVLREAAEIEQAKGIIRPVTANLCGLVLGRFATGLPRGFRPGGLIRGFLREAVGLPAIREVTPKLIPPLITGYVTKRPRTIAALTADTGLDEATIRGCFRVLGRPERGIVRPLDPEQNTWEISHDFLVPLLDSIFARWSVSLWRRTRPFLPWLAAASLALVTVAISVSIRPKDPITELTELGWKVEPREKGDITFSFVGQPRWPESAHAFRRLRHRRSIGLNLSGIESLTGIEVLRECQNIPFLFIDNIYGKNDFADLGPLRELKSLSFLFLGGNIKVTDVTPLRELKSLSFLDLSRTGIADISPLHDVKSLTELNLSDTKITDLSPLRELRNLSGLNLINTDIADISPLRELVSLQGLDLSDTKITDLSPLRELRNLSGLNLPNTEIADISPLRELVSLQRLDLRNTKVTDISAVRALKNLSSLDVSDNNGIADFSPLRELKKLSSLNLSGTRITDIKPLGDVKSLTELSLADTRVVDLSPLMELEKLSNLNLSGTNITTLTSLRYMKSLSRLELRNTRIADLSPLRELKTLSWVDLSGTNITDRETVELLKQRGVSIDGAR